ncbi:MAG: tetratricopeptide repeat protein [Syntrophomonadaceae bacterium]
MAVHREQVLQSAEKLLSRGKLDQALKEYLRVLEEHPKDIPTLNKVGDLYVRMNRPGDSIPYFERIADFYSKDGFFLKAIAIYKKINKIDPARLEVYDRLADLYHKQGLVQDARSQYQVLADHYQKNNRIGDAIGVYKKMAGIDPADLRIQVRLADLYRAANQKDQAVMQYGLIGSMLLKRGAHDEAAQVFQKALELSPDDVETQRNLVRSLLAQKNAAAAMAVLRAAPRTGESLGLMAEAQLELGERAEAVRTAEQALALDVDAETPRLFLARLRVQEHALDRALDAVSPLVLTAVTRREFARAAEYLEPLLAADPGHAPTLEKLAHVLEAEGNRPALAKVHVQLGQVVEPRSPAEAREHYLRAQEADASNVEAARLLQQIGIPTAAPAPPAPPEIEEQPEYQEFVLDLEDSASIHAPQPKVPSIEIDEEPAAPPAPRAPVPPPVAPSGAAREPLDDAQVETLIVEAEVFARYGLADKAIERLFALVRRRPDLLKARERLVELLAETRNPALPREAEALAAALEQGGNTEDARRVLQRAGLTAPASRPAAHAPLPPPAIEVEFEEFDLGQPISPPAEAPSRTPFSADAIDFTAGEPGPAPAIEKLSTPAPIPPVDTEFVSYEQLGNLLEDEMSRAGDAPPRPPAAAPVVDEQNLFADEQKFFNLAEELEKELGEEAVVEEPGEISTPQGEVSLEEIFREFKKGVEQQLSAEDYETHYNLGIAYKEMGLVDEAVGEFQLASKDPTRAVECCSMLGHCFLEKGMPQLAIKWFRKGLETPAIGDQAMAGMLYDLARVYQDTGDMDSAYKAYQEVFGLNANYRDVVQRVKELDAVRRNS